MNHLVLIGASGFGREVLWVCRRAGLDAAGFCDDAADKQAGVFCGLPLLGTVEQAAARLGAGTRFHCAVGDNRARRTLAGRALALGWTPETVVDPTALVAPEAELGAGCYVGLYSVVSCGAQLGPGVIVNHHVTVGHDCRIDGFAQLCPGVRVSGGCTLGEGALMGSNTVLIPGRTMGAWSVLAVGADGLRDIPAGATVLRSRAESRP